MDDATNNNTLQPSFSGTRKRNASIISDHQADIKRAKKAEYNKWYREKKASLKKDTFFVHMAQKIVSRKKHNMLSLLHAACLKLLVFLDKLLLHVQNTLYCGMFTWVEKSCFREDFSRQWPFFKRLHWSSDCVILGKEWNTPPTEFLFLYLVFDFSWLSSCKEHTEN